MPSRERIDFTHRELEALAFVLTEASSKVVVEDKVLRRAVERGMDKIERAHRKVTIGQAAHPDVFCNRCDNKGKNAVLPDGQNLGCPGCGYTLGQHPNRVRT